MKKIKKFLFVVFILLLLLVSILMVNYWQFSSKQLDIAVEKVEIEDRAVNILSQAVQIKTISYEDRSKIDGDAFLRLHQLFEKSFPLVHEKLDKEVVNKYSLLYKWQGSDPSLKPFLLMGHMDVVPIEKGTEKDWKQPPFSGKVVGEFIWGRGTMDDKGMIVSILEATELLLKKNFTPKRTIYFCFGHDEEINGLNGALEVAKLLKSRNVELEFVIDEGLTVTKGMVPGIDGLVAIIGMAEKGLVNLELKVTTSGGHSSMPTYPSSIGILSKALDKIETNLLPARISGSTGKMFEYLGPEMSFGQGLAMANLWLLEPLVISQLESKATSNSLLRTTTAVTIVEAGEKANILPLNARAIVNFRIIPGDTVESVKTMIENIIDDLRVQVSIYGTGAGDPTPTSSSDSLGFQAIHKSVCQVFPDVIVAPGLMLARTDGRHFTMICKDIYRFAPMVLSPEDPQRIHGTNERVTIDNLRQCIQFFYHLMQNANQLGEK